MIHGDLLGKLRMIMEVKRSWIHCPQAGKLGNPGVEFSPKASEPELLMSKDRRK
jgi:hypothetical protein